MKFEYNRRSVEITDDGVIFIDVIENEDGSITDVKGSEKLFPANSVLISISQGSQSRLIKTTDSLKATPRGLLDVDESGRTSREGVFAEFESTEISF